MAWQDVAIPFLRVLINDLGSTPTYCEDRLEELLIMSARLVAQDMYFPITYSINIPTLTITPDPYTDDYFINFMVLKAACLVDNTTYRTKAALEGIRATVGPANLSVAGHLKGFEYLLQNGVCKTYEQLKTEYRANQGLTYTIQAVLSPFTSSTFWPAAQLGGGEISNRSGYSYDERLM